jgi:hypothetical protein
LSITPLSLEREVVRGRRDQEIETQREGESLLVSIFNIGGSRTALQSGRGQFLEVFKKRLNQNQFMQ